MPAEARDRWNARRPKPRTLQRRNRALVGRQGGSQPFFGIMTDDCVREYRRMKGAGVRFHGEPSVQPYGTGVTLEDLYGNRIYINQEPR